MDTIESLSVQQGFRVWGGATGTTLLVMVSAMAWLGEGSAVITCLRARPMLQDSVDVLFAFSFPLVYLMPWLIGVAFWIKVKRATAAGDMGRAVAVRCYQSTLGLMFWAYLALQYLHGMDRIILRR